jgi:hypothetical protein
MNLIVTPFGPGVLPRQQPKTMAPSGRDGIKS